MSTYSYIVIDKSGRERKGSMEADDEDKVLKSLRADGFIPVKVFEANMLNKNLSLTIKKVVKPRDLSVFCRQFVSIINAGVTIIDALEMLSTQTENKQLAEAIKDVQAGIQKGETLAEAFGRHKKIFPQIMINMVDAGESSGSLEVALSRLAIQFEKSTKLNAMVKKALIYPIVVCCVALVAVVVLLVKVVPNFASMFEGMDMKLPGITLAVMAASNFVQSNWYVLIAVVVAIVFGIKYFKKTERGQTFFGTLGIKMPLFGKLAVKTASSIFARTMSTLLASGISMIEALEITSRTMTNPLFKRALVRSKEEVSKGVSLSEPLEQSGLFPPLVYHMTKIGEETGDLESMLNKMADYYDEEVEMSTQTVMAALEPMIIIILALIVGVIIAAVMAPMLSMYQGLSNL